MPHAADDAFAAAADAAIAAVFRHYAFAAAATMPP